MLITIETEIFVVGLPLSQQQLMMAIVLIQLGDGLRCGMGVVVVVASKTLSTKFMSMIIEVLPIVNQIGTRPAKDLLKNNQRQKVDG